MKRVVAPHIGSKIIGVQFFELRNKASRKMTCKAYIVLNLFILWSENFEVDYLRERTAFIISFGDGQFAHSVIGFLYLDFESFKTQINA